jgi:predicted alpha/beta-fold hydrolase
VTPYQAPWWLPGGHVQTVYASLFAARPQVAYRRERWDTPDGDFVDVDWLEHPSAKNGVRSAVEPDSSPDALTHTTKPPLVVLFHGLEGSSESHYSHSMMDEVGLLGWRGVVVHFRGCSGAANRLPRAYHSGDSAELDWMLRRLSAEHGAPLYAVGISLGGNVLLKWLGEQGSAASAVVSRAASVSAPIDLAAVGEALGHGFNLVYTRNFLWTMKRKSLDKLERHPRLYDPVRLRRARTLRAFDNLVTAPLHGFADADDYWKRASSKPWLANIAVPTLILNARNDPFLPEKALPVAHEVSPCVTLEFPEEGGHVAFVSGPFPGNVSWLAQRLIRFFGCHSTAASVSKRTEGNLVFPS